MEIIVIAIWRNSNSNKIEKLEIHLNNYIPLQMLHYYRYPRDLKQHLCWPAPNRVVSFSCSPCACLRPDPYMLHVVENVWQEFICSTTNICFLFVCLIDCLFVCWIVCIDWFDRRVIKQHTHTIIKMFEGN